MKKNLKIVTDGYKYALRSGNWFCGYEFRDVKFDVWWRCFVENNCWGTLEQAKENYNIEIKNQDIPLENPKIIRKYWKYKE